MEETCGKTQFQNLHRNLEKEFKAIQDHFLKPDNCATFLRFRQLQPALVNKAMEVAKKHFATVGAKRELPASRMLELLMLKDLGVKSEDEVFKIVAAWHNNNGAVSEADKAKIFKALCERRV